MTAVYATLIRARMAVVRLSNRRTVPRCDRQRCADFRNVPPACRMIIGSVVRKNRPHEGQSWTTKQRRPAHQHIAPATAPLPTGQRGRRRCGHVRRRLPQRNRHGPLRNRPQGSLRGNRAATRVGHDRLSTQRDGGPTGSPENRKPRQPLFVWRQKADEVFQTSRREHNRPSRVRTVIKQRFAARVGDFRLPCARFL